MASWPETLPDLIQIGTKVTPDDSVARTPMDAGPSSTRNRFTAVTKSVSRTMKLNGAQVDTLDAFYRDTLRNGALSFDWKDPIDDSAVRMKFKRPIEHTLLGGRNSVANREWLVSLSLEIQP